MEYELLMSAKNLLSVSKESVVMRVVSQRERQTSEESVRHWLPTSAVPFANTRVRSINQLVISGGNQFCGAGAVN